MKKNDKLKLFFYVLALIIFIEPQGFKEPDFKFYYIDYIYKILKLIVGFILILNYIYNKKNDKKIDWFIGLTFLYQGFLFLSTVINNGDLIRFAGPSITVISMAILAKEIIINKMLLPVIKKINIYFLVCYIINVISMLIIGISDTGIYFLGIDNRFVWTFFPWIVCVGIECLLEKGKYTSKYYLTFILVMLPLFIKWSVAAMVVMILFIIPPFLKNRKIYYRIVGPFYLLFNFILTKFNLSKVSFLKYFVTDILKKDMTYSGRTFIWQGIYKNIIDKPLLGFGMQSIINERNFFFSTSGSFKLEFLRVMHAHNSFMTILYRGGLLSLGTYISILCISLKSLCKNYKNILSPLLLIGSIVIFLLSLFDTIDFAFLFFFFGICNYINFIVYKKEKNKISNTNQNKKIKLLYVLTALSYGGVEQLIYSYIKKMDLNKYSIDIVTQGEVLEEIKEKYKSLGCNVYKLPGKKQNLFKHFCMLNKIMREEKYDVIHCNMTSKSFYYLIFAKRNNIKLRIAHAHGYTPKTKNIIKNFKTNIYNRLTSSYSNYNLASSKEAGDFLFGDKKYTILPNGIDCSKFKFNKKSRMKIRKKMNISETDFLIGHVGRFDEIKNQRYILPIMKNLIKEDNKYKFLFIGTGELKSDFKDLCENNGLLNNVFFIDSTTTPEEYYSAMDLFVFPSLNEGFGISVIEANCSGIMCICSSKVPKETNVLKINKYLSFSDTKKWLMEIKKSENFDRIDCYKKISKTKYNIVNCSDKLNEIYLNYNNFN